MQPTKIKELERNEVQLLQQAMPLFRRFYQPTKIELPSDFTDNGLLAYAREVAVNLKVDKVMESFFAIVEGQISEAIAKEEFEELKRTEEFNENKELEKKVVGDNL